MAMVSARSSRGMCGSACWIGAPGVGQVRAGQVTESREVTSAARVIGGVRGHGRHPAVSGRRRLADHAGLGRGERTLADLVGESDRAGGAERELAVAVLAGVALEASGRHAQDA